MSTSSFDNDTAADSYAAVDLLASDFLARYRDGDRPSIDEYARRHPSLGDEIRRMFPLIASVEKLKIDQQISSDGSATLAGRQLNRLGDFRIIQEIGRGGMGIVFEAEQESLGRSVAIKVLPKQCLLDNEALQRFQREAQMAAAMHHSNIVPIFGTGESDGSHFLVMQLVRGEALDKTLANLNNINKLMPVQQIAEIGEQVTSAIAYAHENGVLHRDIKPANILLEKDGTAQVTDFGLARNTGDDPTTTRTLSGSLRYMAPERFRGVSDERSDVYSIGLTLFEMATGQPAFAYEDTNELIRSMSNPSGLSVKKTRRDIPVDLETIITKAVHPEPSLRYQTANALQADINRFLADEPIEARRISTLQRITRCCRRNPKLTGAFGIAAMSLITATVVSTTAYFETSAANQRSLKALEESELSLDLAVQTLDGVVEVVSVGPSVATVQMDSTDANYATVEEMAGMYPPDISISPSPYSAQVLERLQPLYERISQQAPTRPDIIIQMVDASIQLARIQSQLGRTPSAIKTLQSSIDMLNVRSEEAHVPQQEKSLRLGRLLNELGGVYSANLNSGSADRAFEDALKALETSSKHSSAAKLEVARSHLALGDLSPSSRRHRRPDTQEIEVRIRHAKSALSLLDDLPDTEIFKRATDTLRAKCWLVMSRLSDDRVTKQKYLNTAVNELREQLDSSPDDASIRFQLVQVLGDAIPQRNSQRQMIVESRRLEEALSELQPLRTKYATTPTFSVAEVHLRHKLSAIARSTQHLEKGNQQLQRAIEIQSKLVEAWPNSMMHRCWRALLYRSLAECSREQDDLFAATEATQLAHQDLDSIAPESSDHPFVIQAREIISRLPKAD